jgi:hypothetical protein
MTRFFVHFRIAAVKEFLVRNRPNPVPETFVANVQKLCHLKYHFLSDMQHEIVRRGESFKEQVIEAHARDIAKRDKQMPSEVVVAIKIFLNTAIGQAFLRV